MGLHQQQTCFLLDYFKVTWENCKMENAKQMIKVKMKFKETFLQLYVLLILGLDFKIP